MKHTPVWWSIIHVDTSSAETGIFWDNQVNTMAADDLAPVSPDHQQPW